MNFPRALIKAATFYVTFCLGFFPAYYFSPAPPRSIVRPRFVTQEPPAPRAFNVVEDMRADVNLVIMDRANGRSYTRLSLLLYGKRPAPEKLWVRTYFFLPADPARRVWAGPGVEIHRPFAEHFDTTVTVAAPCGICDDEDVPQGGYFARVQFFADGVETPLPDGERFFDITTATPVLVNIERAGEP